MTLTCDDYDIQSSSNLFFRTWIIHLMKCASKYCGYTDLFVKRVFKRTTFISAIISLYILHFFVLRCLKSAF